MTETLVLTTGEALIDIVHSPGGKVAEYVGGSPANVAMGLARLGHPSDLATYVGSDERGVRIAEHLAERGVSLTPGSDSADRTPTAEATVDEDGVATYVFDLQWTVPETDTTAYGHLHTGSIACTLEPGGTEVLELMEAIRPHGTVSYDPNARPTIMGTPQDARQRIEECIGRSDVVKCSTEDAEWLYEGASMEEIAREWGRLGPPLIIITRGGDGAMAYLSETGESVEVDARRVEVEDTVGAGDSFMSGLVSGLLDEGLLGSVEARERLRTTDFEPIKRAVARAVATASFTVVRAGAQAPTREELTDS